ncbi:unconventional myosin-IXAa-like isoform X2 [Liolophura sinensis]|uniref:unconventional myosin-IXAa-like isoform X2 n=1 Tax=Liolophura sinensis TaxID=3198878 RepID=UPI00315842C6
MAYAAARTVKIVPQENMEVSMVRVYAGPLTRDQDSVLIPAERTTTVTQVRNLVVTKLKMGSSEDYELSEIVVSDGQLCKERKLGPEEYPVQLQALWPQMINAEVDQEKGLVSGYRFYIHKKDSDSLSRTPSWAERSDVADFLTSFLRQSTSNKEYPDLCNLPDLNEQTLLENIKARFVSGNIYTYVGSILIAVNPFKFFPIYNPTYVKMYQNKRLGELPPHIFAIADAAFHKMLRTKQNQCIVISGESGSGKTESTNLLLHHLTALSQKGMHASGVEQTILGAGPVLEAFGNAKTVHNNNSSRFGKFIQVNYKENGMVHGAVVEKYLLEKSRIVAQAKDERNYHVFYYLLAGAEKKEVDELQLYSPEKYHYLNQSECCTLEGVDEVHEFARLRESMELVGFSAEAQGRIFSVLSAVLHLGNIEFRKKGDQSYDESVIVKNMPTITIISNLLKVKENTLLEALTQKKTIAGEETLVLNYKMEEAIATRDAMAKCLYGALFDWIVLKVNHALLAKRHHSEHQDNSIGVLDIFGFEDFQKNHFEQFCINYANEHLQYYFNQHIFKFEQEEYRKEGIEWKNIEFIDNTGCLELFSKRPNGLFCQLDEECNFPAGTNDSLLEKYHQQHRSSPYYSAPTLREPAFCIEHYAGKVKYTINDFREKNNDLVRMDIVGVLKNSSLVFVRELMGVDPLAVLRWSILRAVFKCVFAFKDSGKRYQKRGGRQEKRRSLHITTAGPHAEVGLSVDPAVTTNGTDECLSDLINEEALVLLSQQPNLSKADCRVIRKASKVLLKNKPTKLKTRQHRSSHDIRTLKSIASRAKFTGGKLTSKKAPPSVSTQFQWSLTRLLGTLNQANPFFIRCIKSNAEKAPCKLDDAIVLRQLRYTGMLATVKIRQSGYNYRLSFDEFSQMYKILLPNGESSSQEDIKAFLEKRDLNKDNYQVGITKVFLREADKILLDEALHNAIMERVVRIQRWMKTLLQQQRFQAIRVTVLETQRLARGYLARRRVEALKSAIIDIQCWVRGYLQRKKYAAIFESVVFIQRMVRGYIARKRYRSLLWGKRQAEEEAGSQKKETSSTSDRGSSAEDLDNEDQQGKRLSSESSGILEDADIDHLLDKAKATIPASASPLPSSPSPQSPNTPTKAPLAFLPPTSTVTPPVQQSLPLARTYPHVTVHAKSPARSPADEEDYLVIAKNSSNRVQALREGFASKQDEDLAKITPGKKKMMSTMSAPLAKQESISDISPEEPVKPKPRTSKKGVSLSLPKKDAIEEALKKHKDRGPDPHSAQSPSPEKNTLLQKISNMIGQIREAKGCSSPYHILRHTRSTLNQLRDQSKSKVKRDQQRSQEESDEDPKWRPQDLGVQVLPVLTNSPLSPRKTRDPPQTEPKQTTPPRKEKRVWRRPPHVDPNVTQEKEQNFNLGKMYQWQYDPNLIISNIHVLQQLDEFLAKKMKELNKDQGKRDTICDVIFKKALREFHYDMKASSGIGMQEGTVNIKYRDIMKQFENIIMSQAKRENTNATFPVTMGVNAFRGFLDEFMRQEKKPHKNPKRTGEKMKKARKDFIEHLSHRLLHTQFNIPTFCESCSNLMWIREKGLVCQYCKYTCHKRCYNKSNQPCKGYKAAQDNNQSGYAIFGAPIFRFCKDSPGWSVIEKLINTIETQGLYTVGIYRKPGAAQKIKQLKTAMNEDCDNVDFEEYHIHVLTTTLKNFFREMPEPLLTFDLYDDFIKAAEVVDEKDKLQGLYAVIDKLPRDNHDLFERLIFHLARVAQHEHSNKMSPNGLAILFAPCLMWTNKKLQAQDSLDLVPKQTMCIEYIIKKQLNKLKTTLADISTLESAQETAAQRLSVVAAVVRASMRVHKTKEEVTSSLPEVVEEDELDVSRAQAEVKVLSEHINSLTREKNTLTSKLPTLELRHVSTSDDDFTSDFLSMDDAESTLDSLDDNDEAYEEYAVTFDLPVAPPQLQHLNKGRAALPARHLPVRYEAAVKKAKEKERINQYSSVMELESRYINFPRNLNRIREEGAEILV